MEASHNVLAEVCGPDILGRIASFLPPNEVACTLRLVSRSTKDHLREQTVARLSQPSPAAAFAARWSAPGACRALSYKRRLQLLCLTATSGDVGNLEVALAAAGLCLSVKLMAAAAAAGQLHVCRWLVGRGCPMEGRGPEDNLVAAAAKCGHAEICEWLLEQGYDGSWEGATSAARGGHPELMRALLRKVPPPRPDNSDSMKMGLLQAAAEGCDLGTLQELWREWVSVGSAGVDWERVRSSGAGTPTAVAAFAARSPTPDWVAKVAWLLEQGAERSLTVASAAASRPDALARLTLLVEGMGFPVDASTIDSAALMGRADAVRWLLARGLRFAPAHKVYAAFLAKRGHTEVLRALHAGGCPLSQPETLVACAFDSGSVETVSWVVETFGAEALQAAGTRAFDTAIRLGSLELVTWLRERGLGPGPDAWLDAAEGGCVAVLERLPEWGADVQAPSSPPEAAAALASHPYLTAARRGDLLTLETLRRLGLPLGRTQQESRARMAEAIKCHAPLPALRWLRRVLGEEVDWAAAAEGAREEHHFRVLSGWRTESGLGSDVVAWVQAEAAAAAAAQARE